MVIPCLCGLLLAPVFIVLHEGGHVLASIPFGLSPILHYGKVTYHASLANSPHANWAISAAGPLVQVLLAGGGLLWLYERRRQRRVAPATCLDWVATSLTFNSGRWMAGGAGTSVVGTALKDEMVLSGALGIPSWCLISLLTLAGFCVFIATIRLHPPGSRLLPFVCAGIGGFIGVKVWLHGLGPLLLP